MKNDLILGLSALVGDRITARKFGWEATERRDELKDNGEGEGGDQVIDVGEWEQIEGKKGENGQKGGRKWQI